MSVVNSTMVDCVPSSDVGSSKVVRVFAADRLATGTLPTFDFARPIAYAVSRSPTENQ